MVQHVVLFKIQFSANGELLVLGPVVGDSNRVPWAVSESLSFSGDPIGIQTTGPQTNNEPLAESSPFTKVGLRWTPRDPGRI